jgi:hypothetical protein
MFKSSDYAAPTVENCYSGAVRQGPAAHALGQAYGGFYGAAAAKPAVSVKLKAAVAAKPAKPAVTKAQLSSAVSKNKFLTDEDRALATHLAHGDLKAAAPILKKLAQARDQFRKKSIAAAEGKTVKQVAGRAYLGVVTLGASELGRLLVKKKISSARRKRAQAYLDKAVACDTVLRFYSAGFAAEAAKHSKKPNAQLTPKQKALLESVKAQGATLQSLEKDGAMADAPDSAEVAAVTGAAEREVEAEAPASAVAKEAASEDPAAVQAPVATEGEAVAITEATNAGAAPEKAAEAVADASGRPEMTGKAGLTKNAKIGIGVGVGVGLLAALKFFK